MPEANRSDCSASHADHRLRQAAATNRREFLLRCGAAMAATPLVPAVAAADRGQAIPGPLTEVRPHRGKPTFFIDGQPYTKPVFETYVPETKYFRQFRKRAPTFFRFPRTWAPASAPPPGSDRSNGTSGRLTSGHGGCWRPIRAG